MDPVRNGLRDGQDLYILLPTKKTQSSAQSNQASSADDSSSSRTTRSTSSTTATTNATEAAASDTSTRRTHRYTITASNGSRDGASRTFVPKPEHSKSATEASRPRGGTVTLSRKCSKAGRSTDAVQAATDAVRAPTHSTQARMSQMLSADAPLDDGDGYGTATILPPRVPAKDAYLVGNEAPSRPIVNRPRYPPSSYRGPSSSSVDIPEPPVHPTPPRAASQKKGPPEQLLFGKLSLDDRNKAIDAPLSPHKPSGISRLVRRLSGRKKNKETSPPPFPRNLPKPTFGKATDLDRTGSSSSIPTAPTPYTSAEEIAGPKKQLKSRRRTLTSSKAAVVPAKVPTAEPASIAQRTASTKHTHVATTTSTNPSSSLPTAEEVYTTSTYFTTCPHTSPPSHLPLNIKPTTTQFNASLLNYPPCPLRTRLACATAQPLPTINIIQGSCSDCDWKARRQQEGEVFAKYADIRNNLLARIKGVRAKMAEREGSSGEESDGDGGRKEKEKTEEDQDLELEMLAVESEIEELPERQDGDVTGVWKGWAAKWGPGTVGIHRRSPVDERYGDESDSEGILGSSSNVSSVMQSSRPTRSMSSASKKALNKYAGQYDDVVAEGRMKLDWIRPDLQKDGKRKDM